jgi:hypothetical protein
MDNRSILFWNFLMVTVPWPLDLGPHSTLNVRWRFSGIKATRGSGTNWARMSHETNPNMTTCTGEIWR